MFEFLIHNADLLVNMLVLVTAMISTLLWSHRKLRQDMNKFEHKMEEITVRLDATNARIDKSYGLILDIMKELKMSKQGS